MKGKLITNITSTGERGAEGGDLGAEGTAGQEQEDYVEDGGQAAGGHGLQEV